MSTAEGAGRTVEEAIQHALKQMEAASRDDVEVEVLQEPRPALLGFGGREARVRLTRKAGAHDVAQAFTTTVLEHLGYQASILVTPNEGGLLVTLEGETVPSLIGRHGRLLDALELLLAMTLQRRLGRRVQVTVDAAGYRARREKAVLEQAQQAVERALAGGVAVALEPMEPRDRRIVHLALRDDRRVSTASEGEGDHRHVVVTPGTAEGSSSEIDEQE